MNQDQQTEVFVVGVLLTEAANATTWHQIVEIARALQNVRQLSQRHRAAQEQSEYLQRMAQSYGQGANTAQPLGQSRPQADPRAYQQGPPQQPDLADGETYEDLPWLGGGNL